MLAHVGPEGHSNHSDPSLLGTFGCAAYPSGPNTGGPASA